MPPINIIEHALERMNSRGITESEVFETVRKGKIFPAKLGRVKFVKKFSMKTNENNYIEKVVTVIADKIKDEIDVISVYAKFY
jgi:hypothetical protein